MTTVLVIPVLSDGSPSAEKAGEWTAATALKIKKKKENVWRFAALAFYSTANEVKMRYQTRCTRPKNSWDLATFSTFF